MKKEGNNQLVTIIITVLITLLLFFSGYFVYQSFTKNNEPKTVEDRTENNVKENYKQYITDFSKLPKQSDNTARELVFSEANDYFTDNELYGETQEKNFELSGFSVKFKIVNGTHSGEKYYNVNAKIDNLIDITPFDSSDSGCSTSYKIIKTAKYYIIAIEGGCDGSGEIELYDKNGKKVYTIDKAVTPSEMVVIDNVLYFNLSTYPTFWNSYIDLSKDNINVVKVKEFVDQH